MNLNKLKNVCEFLTEQMNHWLLFPFAVAVSGITRQTRGFYGSLLILVWVLCSLIPLAFFLIRAKKLSGTGKRSLAFVLILHILAAALPIFTAVTLCRSAAYMEYSGRLLCVGCAVLYTGHSLLLYIKSREPYTRPMQFPVGVGISAVVLLLEKTSIIAGKNWINYYIFPLVICVGLFFIVMYIQRYIDFLNVNKSSAGCLPATEMFHSGLGLAVGYTVFSVAVMVLLTSGTWLGSLSQFLGNSFYKFLRWLFKKLSIASDNKQLPIEEAQGELPGILKRLEQNKTFWLWTVLEYVFCAAMVILLFVVFVRGLLKLFRYLQRLYLLRIQNPEMDGEEVIDIREKCDVAGRAEKKRQKLFGLSPGDMIRRLYKNKVLFSGRQTPLGSKKPNLYTAREWEERLAARGMASIYEQARYSQRRMTHEDVKHMRNACRQGGSRE